MPIDFEKNFGVNAGYVESLFEQWEHSPEGIEASWASYFERLAPRVQREREASAEAPAPEAVEEKPATPEPAKESTGEQLEVLRGLPARIASNMAQSLEVPTATSVRTLPVKVLTENRRLINAHLQSQALGKVSFTHLVAWALIQAIDADRAVQDACKSEDDRWVRITPDHVNLGIAIDVQQGDERALMVPCIPAAETLDFAGFRSAFDDLVGRGRKGKLTAADFKGTSATLTNPGGFGTHMSVPRLMSGQGLIVATGSIGLPPEAIAMSPSAHTGLGIGPVMTVTATYDHRVVQGAQSALLLRRIEALLTGEGGFWDQLFGELRIPWSPARPHVDRRPLDPSHLKGSVQAKIRTLINAYRVRGCRLADLDPLEYKPDMLPSLDPQEYGLTIWDLDREFLAGDLGGEFKERTLREILDTLRSSYCGRWTVEYMHIADRARKHWIRDRFEQGIYHGDLEPEVRSHILGQLYHAQNLERFLHLSYVGNKRFSLEGADSLIPALSEVIERAADHGVETVVIGMAHRGRLNVLANILNKSYAEIFREFEGVLLPLSTEGSGDVKYHLGQQGSYRCRDGREIEVILSANPSHLEAVNPVVCGIVRARQDRLEDGERRRVLGVLIHGDAAFSGQGVVSETLNMSKLRAYGTGGTVHLVVNNQIGFTASPRDLRSTYYCTDIAKSIQSPILHANGDDPEAVVRSVRAAVDYRDEFHEDVVVDMVCYRRWGHNEGDEPAYTQPVLYRKINAHPTVVERYVDLLSRSGAMERSDCEGVGAEFDGHLREAMASVSSKTEGEPSEMPLEEVLDIADFDPLDFDDDAAPDTAVEEEALVEIIDRCNSMPEGHVTHPNLLRQLRRRERMVRGELGIDWGCGEALAFGSLLQSGVSIRLAGQDSGRGTFSQRHSVIRDQTTGQDHIPLRYIGEESESSFEVWDSLLSEEAALGFEYGYAKARGDALVLWEAQFGDFVNGAQIQIDQFIASGESKWQETSGVTLLLPHGYDGQGPEHSSARIERFLALSANGNWRIANCTTSAQYFHLMRNQGSAEQKRPLVVFTPKSLLRDHRAASPVEDFATGGFQKLIVEEAPGAAKRVILTSGKVVYDLLAHRDEQGIQDTAVLRLEQLYPMPRRALREAFDRFPDSEWVWCQEEPRNMGPWAFITEFLGELGIPIRFAGRPHSSSPATGSYKRHQAEQAYLVRRAYGEVE